MKHSTCQVRIKHPRNTYETFYKCTRQVEILTSGGCLFFSVITSTRLLPTICVALSSEFVSTDGTEELPSFLHSSLMRVALQSICLPLSVDVVYWLQSCTAATTSSSVCCSAPSLLRAFRQTLERLRKSPLRLFTTGRSSSCSISFPICLFPNCPIQADGISPTPGMSNGSWSRIEVGLLRAGDAWTDGNQTCTLGAHPWVG